MKHYKKDFNGGGRRGGFNNGGGGFNRKNEMFQAVCADCGNDCNVPFKPNGRKPVLCSMCFKGGDRKDSGRSGYREKKTFQRSSEKPEFRKRSDDSGLKDLKEEMKQMRRKLDRILEILEAVEIVEETDE